MRDDVLVCFTVGIGLASYALMAGIVAHDWGAAAAIADWAIVMFAVGLALPEFV
jgi:hypothetical protein